MDAILPGAIQRKRCKGAQTPESMHESRKRTLGMHFHSILRLKYQGKKSWRVLFFSGGPFSGATWGAQTGKGVEEGCWFPVRCTHGHCAIATGLCCGHGCKTPPAARSKQIEYKTTKTQW